MVAPKGSLRHRIKGQVRLGNQVIRQRVSIVIAPIRAVTNDIKNVTNRDRRNLRQFQRHGLQSAIGRQCPRIRNAHSVHLKLLRVAGIILRYQGVAVSHCGFLISLEENGEERCTCEKCERERYAHCIQAARLTGRTLALFSMRRYLGVVFAEDVGLRVPVRAYTNRKDVTVSVTEDLCAFEAVAIRAATTREVAAAVAIQVGEAAPAELTKRCRGAVVELSNTLRIVLMAHAVRGKVILPQCQRKIVDWVILLHHDVHDQLDFRHARNAFEVFDLDELNTDRKRG